MGVGEGVGVLVGAGVGEGVGVLVGAGVGEGVGVLVGAGVGEGVGVLVGAGVGEGVGVSVGVDDSSLHAAKDMTRRATTRPTNITGPTLFRDRVPTDIISPLIYTSNLKHKRKVLDFIKSGGPELTIGRTIFELWMGDPTSLRRS